MCGFVFSHATARELKRLFPYLKSICQQGEKKKVYWGVIAKFWEYSHRPKYSTAGQIFLISFFPSDWNIGFGKNVTVTRIFFLNMIQRVFL